MPKISVAMGVYNDAQRLDGSIASILAQTFSDFEFIICDDGSTDESYAKLCEWALRDNRIILLKNDRNLTLAPTLNRCIRIAKGEYIARMDSDDIAHPDRFLKQAAFLDKHPEFAVVGSAVALFDEDGFWGGRGDIAEPRKQDFLKGNCFSHPTCMFRREAILEIGGYREDKKFRRVEDNDLFMRLYAKGFKGYNLSAPLLDYYESRFSRGRRRYRYRINSALARYEGFAAMGLLPRGLPYVLKPLIVGLIPYGLLLFYRKRKYGRG